MRKHARLVSLCLTGTLSIALASTAAAQICAYPDGDSDAVAAAGVHNVWFRSAIGAGGGISMPALAAGDTAVLGRYGSLKSYLAICVHRSGGANEIYYAQNFTSVPGGAGAGTTMTRDLYVNWGSAAQDVFLVTSAIGTHTCSAGVSLSAWSYNGYALYQFGDAGDDFITGGDGADRLCGGTNRDILQGNSGNDTLDGWEGGDRLYGDELGQSGTDILWGYSGGDYVGDLSSASSLDEFHGENGDDCLEDLSGSWNFMSCGSGTNDTTYFNGGASTPSDCETRHSGLQTYCHDLFTPVGS